MPLYIPEDIWRYIAQFIPQDDLRDMIGVNSTFFHLAMDVRYSSVFFKDFDDATMERLRRLKDPAIAPRVRRLQVEPLYFQDEWDSSGEAVSYRSSLEDVMQTMTETVACFTRVTEFSIGWRFEHPSAEHMFPFLTTAWKTFGSGLRKAFLGTDVENLPILLFPAMGMFPVLRDLEILFYTRKSSVLTRWEEIAVLVAFVAPFINDVAPTIRSLSLTPFFSAIDFTPVFSSLRIIPNLETLSITMDYTVWRSASGVHGLTRTLRDHAATLRHVELMSRGISEGSEASNAVGEWMEANQGDTSILTNLLTLEIRMPSHPAAFEVVVGYIKRSADTLTSLSLSQKSLSNDQVNAILSIFAHRPAGKRLEALLLHVLYLSPELILMLARMLPCLRHLRLVGTNWDTNGMEERGSVQEFVNTLKDGGIESWQVYDISISECTRAGRNTKDALMHCFAECRPSIRVI